MSRRRRRHSRQSLAPPVTQDVLADERQPPLFTRIEAMVNLAMRTVVPVVGMLFLGYDAKRLATLYFIDTWLCFSTLFGLLIFQYLPIRYDADAGWADWANNYAGYWLFGMFAASCVMFAAAFPMFFVLKWSDVQAMANDQTFRLTVASHLSASVLAFFMQNLRTRVDGPTRLRIRHRIEFTFLRWIAVYLLVMAATQLGFVFGTLGPFGERTLAIILVLAYAGLTVVAELYPEETRRLFANHRE